MVFQDVYPQFISVWRFYYIPRKTHEKLREFNRRLSPLKKHRLLVKLQGNLVLST